MSPRPDSLPSDPAELQRIVLALEAENAELRVYADLLRQMIFGAKSEKLAVLDPTQIALDLGDLCEVPVAANDDAAEDKDRPRRKHRSASRNMGALPKHLPRCEEVIEPQSTVCSCCGLPLHRIGEDVSEALDIVPALLRVIRTIRPKYACRACEAHVVQAPARARVMDGGMATTALVAHVVVSKFAWHLPLYRQSQIFSGYGIHLDRGTLGGWVGRAAWWLRPLYDRLLAFIRSQPRVFCDETPLPRLDPGRKRTKVCQLWAQAVDDRPWQGPAPPAVGYVFAESRGAGEIEAQLSTFDGILQVDGYAAYKSLAKRRRKSNIAPLQLAFCLAHARRKFVEVVKTTGSSEALAVIAAIAEIYRIEECIRGMSAEQRLSARKAESAPLMAALRERLEMLIDEVSAKSSLGKAVAYALAHWHGLIAFLEDGRIEVDSNVVERSLKPVCLTRKNSLFAGSARGGETWAVLASLVNSARLNGLDPETWLADVLEQIVSGSIPVNRLDELLPWNWKADREARCQLERMAA
ncbi:IS66 family transposase [Mesorhizobium sp. M0643]|uniref:IS66 family transposase n=1 Tax=Mesorhizobium sp. M0643 TaxID=2956978 RepID=UPI00333DBD06